LLKKNKPGGNNAKNSETEVVPASRSRTANSRNGGPGSRRGQPGSVSVGIEFHAIQGIVEGRIRAPVGVRRRWLGTAKEEELQVGDPVFHLLDNTTIIEIESVHAAHLDATEKAPPQRLNGIRKVHLAIDICVTANKGVLSNVHVELDNIERQRDSSIDGDKGRVVRIVKAMTISEPQSRSFDEITRLLLDGDDESLEPNATVDDGKKKRRAVKAARSRTSENSVLVPNSVIKGLELRVIDERLLKKHENRQTRVTLNAKLD